MFSNRSSLLALAAVLALTNSSCQTDHHALEVKSGSEADFTHARSDASQPAAHEFEYFEGETAPEAPPARAEERPAAPSPAHVWVAGHYTRHDGQWQWVAGQYEFPPHDGDVWVPGHWVSHLNGFVWIDGAWR